MSVYGKLNLLAMLLLPAVATLAGLVVFGLGPETLFTVFGLNLMVMLFGGFFAAVLIRGGRGSGAVGARIALLPSLVPAVIGSGWYLWRAVLPETVAPGREYIAGPQYLLRLVFGLWVVAGIAGRIERLRRSAD